MIRECFFTCFCSGISRIGFSADKAFVHFNVSIVLKIHQVGSKIPISHLKHLLQVIEANLFINHQYAHYSEADAAVKNFI